MAAPTAVQAITDSTFVSNLDLHKPEIMNSMFRSKGNQGIGYLTIRSLGFERPAASDEWSHFEKNESHENIKINLNAGPGAAGGSLTLQLHADSLNSENQYYPRVNDVLMFPNEVVGWIRTITVTPGGLGGGVDQVDIEVRPHDITEAIPAVTAGDRIIIISGVWSEKSGMPDPAISDAWKYTNNAQIIKEAIGATGTELVTQSWIELYNEANEFQGYYREGQFDLDLRMLTKLDGMFWWGKKIDNTASRAIDPLTGYPLKGTAGLIPEVRRLGHVNTYVPGAYSVDKFDEYERILVKEYIGTDTPVWTVLGLELYQEIENELFDFFKTTDITVTQRVVNDMLFKRNESLGASINFKYLQKSGRTFLFHRNDGWSNPKTYGTDGYDVPKMGLLIPLDKKRDPVSGEDIPSVGVRYRAMGRYNRRMITASLSGIGSHGGGIPIDTIDRTNTYQLSHMGNHFMGLNRFILIDV